MDAREQLSVISGLADFVVDNYTCFYYEYDQSHRVTKETVFGALRTETVAYTEGADSQTDTNAWSPKDCRNLPRRQHLHRLHQLPRPDHPRPIWRMRRQRSHLHLLRVRRLRESDAQSLLFDHRRLLGRPRSHAESAPRREHERQRIIISTLHCPPRAAQWKRTPTSTSR